MTPEEYRNEGFRLSETDMKAAEQCFLEAAKAKDIPSALALASKYYEQDEDDKKVLQWLNDAIDWFDEAGEPEDLEGYMSVGYYLRGVIQKTSAPYLAVIDFYASFGFGMIEAASHLGELIYKGYDSPTGSKELDKAMEYWKYGMENGNEDCAKLYEAHLHETAENYKELTLPNDHFYKGEVNKDGIPEGQGISTYSEECGVHRSTVRQKYTGEFKNGKENGHGVLLVDSYDGEFSGAPDRFEGEFVDGYLEGPGTCQYANGDFYEGNFHKGHRQGHGIYTYADGLQIECDWDYDHIVFETCQIKPSEKAPLLMIRESHSGMDYSHSASFLVIAKKGNIAYQDAILLQQNYRLRWDETLFSIIEVTDDSVTYEVRGVFFKDNKSHKDTIQRGEKKVYEDTQDHTVRIYDDEYDYTSTDEFCIMCK